MQRSYVFLALTHRNELRWHNWEIGHQDSSPRNGHQGNIPGLCNKYYMADDDLATVGARASAAIIETYFGWVTM